MAGAAKIYVKGVHQRFSYLGTWLPNVNLQLGDVGVLDGAEFKQMTTLQRLGIPFAVRPGVNKMDFSHTSQSGVKLQAKVKGEAAVGTTLPLGEAGLAIQFSQEGAFVFQATGSLVDEIENKQEVGQAVLKLVQQGRWDPNWGVVDALVKASCATIIVANSASAGLELTAKTPVQLASLANLDAGLSVSSQSGEVIQVIAQQGLTPLFNVSRVKKPFLASLLGSKRITFGGGAASRSEAVPQGEEVFEKVLPEP